MKVFLFFENELVQTWEGQHISSVMPKQLADYLHTQWGSQIYNRGYLWAAEKAGWMEAGWYRPDRTPLLDWQVPKELKALALLLG